MAANTKVVAEQGDCVASIAAKKGYEWERVWKDGGNAELRESRKDPFVLLPGDEVATPEPKEKSEECPTDRKHNFVLNTGPVRFRVVLIDGEDKPFSGQPYELKIDEVGFKGKTDGSGGVEHEISPSAKEGHLVVGTGAKKREYYLQLGHLDPLDTVSGAQGRLFDLGYYDGAVNGKMDGHTRSALLAFQDKYKVPATGENDKATQDKLKERFGC